MGEDVLLEILPPSLSPAIRPASCPTLSATGKIMVFFPIRALHRISPQVNVSNGQKDGFRIYPAGLVYIGF